MIKLILENISPDGDLVDRKLEEHATPAAAIGRIQGMYNADRRILYPSISMHKNAEMTANTPSQFRGNATDYELRGFSSPDDNEGLLEVKAFVDQLAEEDRNGNS